MTSDLERDCVEYGLRMSNQRRAILRVLEESKDHPSAEEVYRRVLLFGQTMSVATVYRNMALLSRLGLLMRLELGDRKGHYERANPDPHEHLPDPHEHLIDVRTGRIVEFSDARIVEALSGAVADLGYRLVSYRVNLFCSPAAAAETPAPDSPRPPRAVKKNQGRSATESEQKASLGSLMSLPRHRRPSRPRRRF
jgi:Fur family transcriptional regulator, ferric uptake regulator